MKTGLLIAEPNGGLCNRMRVIVSAYQAAKAAGKKPVLFWRNTPDCNCSYTNLFDLPGNIKGYIINTWFRNKLINQIPKILGNGHFYDDNQVLRWSNTHDSYHALRKKGWIYIRTCNVIYNEIPDLCQSLDYTIFLPKPDILASIPLVFTEKNIIGIHIRRTDNVKSIENSPIDLFIENMDREIYDTDGICKFFIATDDEQTKKTLTERYGQNRIITRTDINLSRNSQNGIRDAYIDLLCLSKCSKIYGSYWSSFSECAAEIGKIPLFICRR